MLPKPNRLISAILCFSILFFNFIGTTTVVQAYGGYFAGSGTKDSPYLIYTTADLQQLAKLVNEDNTAYNNKYYRLENDIDLSDTDSWTPIGINYGYGFQGTFDGNNHQIKNLNTYQSAAKGQHSDAGFFGFNRGTIKNLGLVNGKIGAGGSGTVYAGGIAGENVGSISYCYFSGTVSVSGSGTNYAGGIVGDNSYDIFTNIQGVISNCYNTGSISCSNDNGYSGASGGIAGSNDTQISSSYNSGTVSGSSSGSDSLLYVSIGGIVGKNYSQATIYGCYNTGYIFGYDEYNNVGGLAGYNYKGNIQSCYNTGTISDSLTRYRGGIAGYNVPGYITYCYFLSNGIRGIGVNSGTSTDNTTPCTLDQMNQQDIYAGFDFNGTWTMPDIPHTPVLRGLYTPLEGVQLEQNADMVTGEVRKLNAALIPTNATITEVDWSSTNTAVAAVDQKGNVTANSAGNAYIVVVSKQGGYMKSCLITVRQGVESITIPSTLSLYVEDTKSIQAVVSPSTSYNPQLLWTSDNSAIATVDQNGKITALAPGRVGIRAAAVDGSGTTALCVVTVIQKVTGVSISGASDKVGVGQTIKFTADVTPSDASDKNVFWSSSNTGIATVSSSGTVTGVAAGTATITAAAEDGNYKASETVEVFQPVSGVQLNANSTGVALGKQIRLTATILPGNATYQGVTWTSSNTAAATVSQDGTVKGICAGETLITVRSDDGGKLAYCDVTVGDGVEEVDIAGADQVICNNTIQLNAFVLPETAANKTVSWSVVPVTGSATITDNGLLTGISPGTVTVQATASDGTGITGSRTITVKKSIYTVTFKNWDGTVVNTESVSYVSTAAAPTNPTRTGYVFAGWYTDNSTFNNLFDFTKTAITGDMTLYAKWVSATGLKVTVRCSNGAFTGLYYSYNYGDTVTLTTIPDKGYIFLNWTDKRGNILSTKQTYSFTITDNIEVFGNNIDKCDVNKDSVVSIVDLAAIAKSYNKTNTGTEWNQQYDFTGDGIIDLYDLVLCSKRIR